MIDITQKFTDKKFLDYVYRKIEKKAPEPIYDTDVAKIEDLCTLQGCNSGSGIHSLDGIEYFTELKYLNCRNEELTALDISKNTKLDTLYCEGNMLTELDLSKNVALEVLRCDCNQLSALDLSNCVNLEFLSACCNKISEYDLSKLGLPKSKSLVGFYIGEISENIISANGVSYKIFPGHRLVKYRPTIC
jgi:Leucine-rich repeat (LRR) protein